MNFPELPILDKDEIWDGETDLRYLLRPEEQDQLRDDEVVIYVGQPRLRLPENPIPPIEILKKAAKARTPMDIGYMGPTVASVNIFDDGERSRYEIQHGRDDELAAMDVRAFAPKLMDTVARSLLMTQGVQNEEYIPGQPYGFEKPGSIILVDFPPEDPLGQKFLHYKLWKNRFYGSADAPILLVDMLSDLQQKDSRYLVDPENLYPSLVDGGVHDMRHGYDLSLQWILDRMSENQEGLVEYSNPLASTGQGMRNQGWKDSADAIVHTDGTWANSQAGIATIEIQAQAVVALQKAADVYRNSFDDQEFANHLAEKAAGLKQFILKNAWIEDERGGYFAMGWDRDENGELRRIDTRSIDMHVVLRMLDMDNPAEREMALKTVQTLMSEEMFTRWGHRTMSNKEKGYRDLGYHCGVWLDKANRVAESFSAIGLYGLDRFCGSRTSLLVDLLGCTPEHISGEDSSIPVIPDKDVYVYNKNYNEVHMFEQVPPLGQTWGATSEEGKKHRYASTPEFATDEELQKFEKAVILEVSNRYAKDGTELAS
jgi:hypothetical protein